MAATRRQKGIVDQPGVGRAGVALEPVQHRLDGVSRFASDTTRFKLFFELVDDGILCSRVSCFGNLGESLQGRTGNHYLLVPNLEAYGDQSKDRHGEEGRAAYQ